MINDVKQPSTLAKKTAQLSQLKDTRILKAKRPRPRRDESFFGLHFDFHAGTECHRIGENVDEAMIADMLDQVKPDYVQCDSKGHPGFSSYPTRVGCPAPGFVRDPLAIWRRVTAQRGVALFVHYSGVWDTQAIKRHPEWACHTEPGQPSEEITSTFGPYVDELLIPQLLELAQTYDIDGVWIDGECWAVKRDYSKEALRRFREKTGILQAPAGPDEPHWLEFSEFSRQGFRDYLRHYVNEVHRRCPQFQITSNWAFCSYMPEPVSADVDFLSGDTMPIDSIRSARFEARCLAHQGKTWDLMAWGFAWNGGDMRCTKTVIQLQQEAAIILAMGGGFQVYLAQKQDGSIRKWQIPLAAEVARFCRARQAFCHKAVPVPQIGLIYYGKAHYRQCKELFTHGGDDLTVLNGILHCLLNGQQVVDIVQEHQLQKRMAQYPLLIWPEWDFIEPHFAAALIQYVRQGGRLLVIGAKATALFACELGVDLIGEPAKQANGLEYAGHIANLKTWRQKIRPIGDTQPFGNIYADNDLAESADTAATIRRLGAGLIAGVALDMGERYCNAATAVSRDFLSALIRRIFPQPLVTVEGSHLVDVTLNRLNDQLAIHLVNTAGPHQDPNVLVTDEIPPLGPLTLSVRMDQPPNKIMLQPEGKSLPFDFRDGKAHFTVPKLLIHTAIVCE